MWTVSAQTLLVYERVCTDTKDTSCETRVAELKISRTVNFFPSTLRSLLPQAPALALSCGTPGKFPRLVMVDTVPKRQAVKRNKFAVCVTVVI